MPLLILLLVIAAILLGLGYYFAGLIIYPKVFPFEHVYKTEVDEGRLVEAEYKLWQYEELKIRSSFGYDLFAIYHPLEGSNKTVVISHGITWGLYGMVIFAEMFRKRGWNVLIYDLRNHGRSGGKNTTFGYYEKHDLKVVVDYAFSRLNPGGIVGTMGISLGAATTVEHAAMDKRIAFAVSDCGFSSMTQLITYRAKADYKLPYFPLIPLANLWCWILTRGMTFAKASPIRYIGEIEMPMFFATGTEDDYVPFFMSEDLYRAKTKGIRKLYLAPDAGHAQAYWKNRSEYDRQMGEFLQEIGLS